MTSTHGLALRHVKEGPVEVILRTDDFNLQEMQNEKGEQQTVPIRSLVAFSATRFRELGAESDSLSDMWEFQVPTPTPAGTIIKFVYVKGEDILMMSAPSKVAL